MMGLSWCIKDFYKSLPMMPIETRKINNAHKNKDDFTYINKGKQPNRKSKRKRYWRVPRLSDIRTRKNATVGLI